VTFDGSDNCEDVGDPTVALILGIHYEATIPPVNFLGKIFFIKFGVISEISSLN
jgi:hypothetical protein